MLKNYYTSKRHLCLACVLAVVFITTSVFAVPVKPSDAKPMLHQVMKVRVPFVANEGQVSDKTVKYYTRTFGGNFYVRDNGEMVYLVSSQPERKDNKDLRRPDTSGKVKTTFIKEMLVDAKKTSVEAKDQALAKVNSFVGNDRSKWKTNMPTYGSVSLGEVYEGITLSLKAYGNTVEKVFTVNPGADPKSIRLAMAGGRELKVDEKGDLVISTDLGPVSFSKPIAYQEIDNKRVDVPVAYRTEKEFYSFDVGHYDKRFHLQIDPYYLSVSTFLGGSSHEIAGDLAVDSSGNAYVTGWTMSANYPTSVNAWQPSIGGSYDVFIAKLSADGSQLLYSTYLGGSEDEDGLGIAVDALGNAYVAGFTVSDNFPITAGAFQTLHSGDHDAFIAKLSADGSQLLYSTYLGGSAFENGYKLSVDASGIVYVAGFTGSGDFPTTPDAFQTSLAGGYDAFIARLSSDGSQLLYSTYLGGTSTENCLDIAIDESENVYVTGITGSGFPTTAGAFQTSLVGDDGAFIAKLSADGSQLLYSTYLGGSNLNHGHKLSVDASGNVYVTGITNSPDFPTTVGAFQILLHGDRDAFIAKLSADGSQLLYSTYLGGSEDENGLSIAVDPVGNVYVTGWTNSADFPTSSSALQTSLGGGNDAFIAKLSSDGSQLLYSTYLGGSGGDDGGHGIAVDEVGNVYATGYAVSDDFPTRLDSYQPHFKGTVGIGEAFIVKLIPGEPDFTPPTFTVLTQAYKETQPVPHPVIFQVHIQDSSGVYYNPDDPAWSIILRQRNVLLGYTYDPATGILTYTDASGTMFQKGQCYTVTVEARDMLKNVDSLTLYFTVADPDNPDPQTGYYPCPNPSIASPAVCLLDSDYDGIPNDGITLSDGKTATADQQRTYGSETHMLTSLSSRTLYIRPLLKQPDGSVVLWEDFEQRHLPEVSKPFNKLGIELRTIPNLTYNPYTDPNAPAAYKPPISIVEITYDLAAAGQSTFFSTTSRQWYWGLLGLTPYETGDCVNKTQYGYFRTTIFGNSVKHYIYERQYSALTAGMVKETPQYDANHDPDFPLKSPMNFGNDGTVEFNSFIFNDAGTIASPVPQTGAARLYTEEQVIQRLIAHEIGHTLLNASEGDHCANPSCIMYGALSSVAGWGISGTDTAGKPIGFGPGSGKTACTHSLAKTYDLRPRVYNALNPRLLPPNTYNCPLP